MMSKAQSSEHVFSKLTEHGYSQNVADRIYYWYHPSRKGKVSN